jgi:hypothetical protein
LPAASLRLRAVVATPASDRDEFVPYIPHGEFVAGLPHGHFRMVVNPTLARPYVVRRTRVIVLSVTVIAVGAALALAGQVVVGGVLVALGIVANRIVRHQAGKIVLHLAARDPQVYDEVTSNGVMEVRRAA